MDLNNLWQIFVHVNYNKFVKFEVLMAVTIKITAYCNVTLCILVTVTIFQGNFIFRV
jgi:hypothetical protein